MKKTLKELKEQAEELINCGNSKEKAEGVGMMNVINSMNYVIDKSSEYSYEIKTELLQITEAFELGAFVGFVSFEPVKGYILSTFATTTGVYKHYFRIKNLTS